MMKVSSTYCYNKQKIGEKYTMDVRYSKTKTITERLSKEEYNLCILKPVGGK